MNENILPRETQKLIIRSPFPLYAIGTIYENIVVVKAIVIPNVNPYKNLTKSINPYVLTSAKEQHTPNWNRLPYKITGLLPYLSENFPDIKLPANIPR